jgi:menaquinone-dependent protoporphyrinogen oxidase
MPQRVRCFAGKLAYSQYGFLTRQAMRFIAWREGAPTDTQRDYEFTDWAAVRQFALDFAADVRSLEHLENRPAV